MPKQDDGPKGRKYPRGYFHVPLVAMPASQVEQDALIVQQVNYLRGEKHIKQAIALAWFITGRKLQAQVLDELAGYDLTVYESDDDEIVSHIGEQESF